MKRAYKAFWILILLLIPVFPLTDILYGVDISDVGLSINQYRFCFEDIDSVYLPILLSELMGGAWLKICEILSVPSYLGVQLLWTLCCYYLCFISYRIYKRYRNDDLVLPALAIALVFAKCNFHYFIYATGVAVMALTGLYFLIRALNDKKPKFLSAAVFFIVMACVCKISSMLQFAVFAVLFYDFYKKKDRKYFIKQILYCVLGFVIGIIAALLLAQLTCGVQAYGEMIAEMFLYAGNSEDGHTIGNMIASNAKGALRGILLLGALGGVYLIPKKRPKSRKLFAYGIPAAAVLLVIGKAVGLDSVAGFSVVYGVFLDYLNALAVVTALIYICVGVILCDEEYSQEFKNLALAAGLLTVLMPIGSNTGIQHLCNELYFSLPFIVICVGDRVRRAGYFAELLEKKERKLPPVGVMLTVFAALWCVGLASYQSLYVTRMYLNTEKDVRESALEELKFKTYETDTMDELEEITAVLKPYENEYKEYGRKLLVAGNAPILNYLSGIPPYNAGCGGWIETEFITYEKIEEQLEEVEIYPIVVFCHSAMDNPKPKIQLVIDFVDENAYEMIFTSDAYSVFVPIEE